MPLSRNCLNCVWLVWLVGCGAATPRPVEIVAHAAASPVVMSGVMSVDPAVQTESTVTPPPIEELRIPVVSMHVAHHVRELAERVPRRSADTFIKVGDSATVNRAFLRCLSRDRSLGLASHESELRPVIEAVRSARIGGVDSFSRESQAAGVGWSVHRVLRGSPTPVAQEVRNTNPRFAFVMFGSNDVELGRISRYATRLTALVEQLLGWGVMPVLSTIPPRRDDLDANAEVPRYNAVIFAIASAHRIPVIDLHSAMMALPRVGLASDGVHPNAPVVRGRARGCDFSESGLQHGQNVRNVMTLQMLASLRRALESSLEVVETTVDVEATAAIEVSSARFATQASTVGGLSEIDSYPACGAGQDERGPERRYRLRLDAPTRVRAEVMYAGRVDVDVHLLRAGECVERGDRRITVELEPGDYEIVVDTFGEHAGEYLLLVEQVALGPPPQEASRELASASL